jgi:hypothetical protein
MCRLTAPGYVDVLCVSGLLLLLVSALGSFSLSVSQPWFASEPLSLIPTLWDRQKRAHYDRGDQGCSTVPLSVSRMAASAACDAAAQHLAQ